MEENRDVDYFICDCPIPVCVEEEYDLSVRIQIQRESKEYYQDQQLSGILTSGAAILYIYIYSMYNIIKTYSYQVY